MKKKVVLVISIVFTIFFFSSLVLGNPDIYQRRPNTFNDTLELDFCVNDANVYAYDGVYEFCDTDASATFNPNFFYNTTDVIGERTEVINEAIFGVYFNCTNGGAGSNLWNISYGFASTAGACEGITTWYPLDNDGLTTCPFAMKWENHTNTTPVTWTNINNTCWMIQGDKIGGGDDKEFYIDAFHVDVDYQVSGAIRTVNENLGTYSDMINISQELSRNLSESLTYSDMVNVSITQEVERTAQDTMTFAEMVNVTVTTIVVRTINENIGTYNDMVNISQELSRNVSDSMTYNDMLNLSQELSKNLSDTMTYGEDITRTVSAGVVRTVNDNIGTYNDMVNITQELSRNVSDTASYSDMVNYSQEISRNVSDNFAYADMINYSQELIKNISDSASYSDMVNKSQELSRNISDSATYTDMVNYSQEITRNISDSMTYGENIIRTIKIPGVEERSAFDSANYNDMINISQEVSKYPSDVLTYSEMVNTSFEVSRAPSDALSYSEMTNTSQEITRNVSDTASYVDMINISQELTKSVSDSMTYNEMVNKSQIISRSLSDSLTYSEMTNKSQTLIKNGTDSMNYQDMINLSQELSRNLSESLTYSESIIGRTLGYLEMVIVQPVGSILVKNGESFLLNATITCREKNCGDINATARYDTNVINTSGILYVDTMLRNCTLNQDETCYVNWTVYTGSDGNWNIDVNATPYDNDTADISLSVYSVLQQPGPGISYGGGPLVTPLLDLVITNLTPVVFAGGEIRYTMELTNIGKITSFDAVIHKRILKGDTILFEETFTKAMRDKVIIEDYMKIPDNFDPGTYFLELFVEYNGKSTKGVATFEIKKDCLVLKTGSFDIFRQRKVVRVDQLKGVSLQFDNICNMPLTSPVILLDDVEMRLNTISREGFTETLDFERYGLYKANIQYKEGYSEIEFYIEGWAYDVFPIALMVALTAFGLLGYKFLYPTYIQPLFRKPPELEEFLYDLERETIKALRRKFKQGDMSGSKGGSKSNSRGNSRRSI